MDRIIRSGRRNGGVGGKVCRGEAWGYALTAYRHYKCPVRKGFIANEAHWNVYGWMKKKVDMEKVLEPANLRG